MDKELTNYDKREELEALGKMWFSSLRQLENLTNEIAKNETLEELELIDMRDNIKKLYSLLQHYIEVKAIKNFEKMED